MARDQNPGKSYRGVDPVRAHEGLVMKVTAAKMTPCIHVSVCGDCSGIPEAIGVHLSLRRGGQGGARGRCQLHLGFDGWTALAAALAWVLALGVSVSYLFTVTRTR